MGFLNFLAKFSFIGYAFNERKRGKQIAAQQYGHVMEEKETMEKQLTSVEEISNALVKEMDNHKKALSLRPKVASRDAFLDDRGVTPSQLRSRQLDVLQNVVTYDKMFDTEISSLQTAFAVRDNWCDKLDCAVEIKKKKVSSAVINRICEQLGDNVDGKDISATISNGGRLKETFVFNDAQIIVNVLASYGITAKAVSIKAQNDVKADSALRDPEEDIPAVAKHQRFALAGLYIGFMLLVMLFTQQLGYSVMWIFMGVGAVLIFFVHWLLTKPIVAIAVKIVEFIFRKGGADTMDSATYLRGIFLTDIFDKGLDALDAGIIKYIDGVNENYTIYRKWALVFMTPRVLDELLYEVVNQMSTGASYNAAINNAEAKVDRQQAAKKQQERLRAMEQENMRHNIEMEKQARARADYARQCANNAAAAAQAMRDYASAQRETARAEKQKVEELKKIRRDLNE